MQLSVLLVYKKTNIDKQNNIAAMKNINNGLVLKISIYKYKIKMVQK